MRTERAWAVARADGSVVSGELAPPRWPKVPVLRVLASLVQGLGSDCAGRPDADRTASAATTGCCGRCSAPELAA